MNKRMSVRGVREKEGKSDRLFKPSSATMTCGARFFPIKTKIVFFSFLIWPKKNSPLITQSLSFFSFNCTPTSRENSCINLQKYLFCHFWQVSRVGGENIKRIWALFALSFLIPTKKNGIQTTLDWVCLYAFYYYSILY